MKDSDIRELYDRIDHYKKELAQTLEALAGRDEIIRDLNGRLDAMRDKARRLETEVRELLTEIKVNYDRRVRELYKEE